MVFSSIQFLFAFLPATLLIYLIILKAPAPVNQNTRLLISNYFIFGVSVLFYSIGESFWVLLLLISVIVNYFSALCINKGIRENQASVRRIGLTISILTNLSILFFFKYAAFFTENFNSIVNVLHFDSLILVDVYDVVLPLGISFYTFQSMSYNIDVYRGHVKATKNFINFACYVTMFSQLVAGPIIRYRDICERLTKRVINKKQFIEGAKRFVWGLSKKVLIANTLSIPVDNIFSMPEGHLTVSIAWLGAILYSLQIYFDFSGYSDMAIGIGLMFGFNFPENFNYPYISKSIQDFWRRWHISLSTWFRDYLYIPLGGNRISSGRTYVNILIVFLLCGFWHGASWTFIIWGLYHGVFLVIERFGIGKYLEKKNNYLSCLYSIPVIVVGWVIFRTENLSQTASYLAAMFGMQDLSETQYIDINMLLTTDVRIAFVAGILFSTPLYFLLKSKYRSVQRIAAEYRLTEILISGIHYAIFTSFFIYCSIVLASGRENPFIYFRF